jgi:hypothetical protein
MAPSSQRTGVAPSAVIVWSLCVERDIARSTGFAWGLTCDELASAFVIAPPTNPDAPVRKIVWLMEIDHECVINPF